MSCAPKEQPSLFTDLEAPLKVPARRNPPRKAASRQRELQVRLPIVQGAAAELLRLEDLVLSQRPLTRADCEEEASPCPWVSCPWHVYWGRAEEFEAIIDAIEDPNPVVDGSSLGPCRLLEREGIGSGYEAGDGESWPHPRAVCDLIGGVACEDRDPVIVAVADALVRLFVQTEEDSDGRARRPKTPAAVAAAVHGGRAVYTSAKGKAGVVSSDVLSSTDVRGPWPTCMLDVAQDVREGNGELAAEDTGRLLDVTREAVRLIEGRVRRDFARAQELRPWLTEIVDEDRLDEFAELDWFGDE